MKKRRITVVVLALVLAVMLIGCGASYDSATQSMTSSGMSKYEAADTEVFYNEAVREESDGASAPESMAESGSSQSGKGNMQTERKLIKTVDMSVETKEFDKTLASVEAKIAELGGYIENMETYNGSSYSGYRSSRNAHMMIRIPKNELNTFLETVEGVCNVVRRSESVEDITLTYVDLESHKKVLLAEQESLLTLLKKAETVEDIITLERRLTEVRYQIESMESQLRTFDNKVDYSTVYLDVQEVRELTPVAEETIPRRIVGGFKESLRDIGDGLVEFGIWFVVNIPYFVVWIIVLAIAIPVCKVLIRLLKGGRKGRKAKSDGNKEIITSAEKE